jgi:hypothetical protein
VSGHCTTPAITRLWRHVEKRDPDECWPWTGHLTRNGTRPGIQGGPGEKSGNATRFVLQEKLGRPLRPGYEACHTCDWPACCNPAHLWEGTHADNVADRDAKGRTARGERHGNAKFSDELIRAIRSYPGTPKEAAAVFGCSPGYVCNLRSFVARREQGQEPKPPTRRMLRVPGHILPNRGIRADWRPGEAPALRHGTGVARCSCGETSPVLPSTKARTRWHRDHKLALLSLATRTVAA